MFKANVCDSMHSVVKSDSPFTTMEGILDFDYSIYALISHEFLHSMQQLFAQGKRMMDVSDEEIDSYRREREKIEAGMDEKENARHSMREAVMQLQGEINAARENL